LLVCLLAITTFSCGKSKKNLSIVSIDTGIRPDMHTEGVSTLISDSGIVRYRIETEIWDTYSNIEEPYSYFPEGFYLERFDSLFNIEFIIQADTVYYHQKKGLWQAINNVFIKNIDGHTVETSELFFDEKAEPGSREAIYTDKFVRINEGNRMHSGYGLKSNSSLSDWVIYQSSHEVEYNETDNTEHIQAVDATETLRGTSLEEK
jgi:Ethanolamine utilization protein